MESLKTCSTCKIQKNISEFKKKQSGDYLKSCIICNIKIAKKRALYVEKKKIEKYNKNTHKQCSQCYKILLLADFKLNNKETKTCNNCKNKKSQITPIILNTKQCNRCKKIKNLSDFKINKKKNYLKNCIICNENLKKYKQTNTEKFIVVDIKNNKKCSKCKKIKGLDCFNKRKNNIYNKQCIECNKKQMQFLAKNKCEHGYLNKSQCKKCKGASICEHKKIKTYCNICKGGSLCEHNTRKDRCSICRTGSQFCEHNTIRSGCVDCKGGSICDHGVRKTRCFECNFSGYLKSIISSRIYKALKSEKNNKSLEYLGCDILEYKKYIESKFNNEMTWDNYGTFWHIDHVIPIMYNNPTTEQVIERLHYLNTQPLKAEDNISKGNRFIG